MFSTTTMVNEPKVTGLSPMTGPPGTRITVRGENLGQSSEDIIKLTINGADCLPYLDWKSPKKIITRCTKSLGSGDIIVVTKSGGIGTCDVQFNCYEELVGPTDECQVWVDELDYQVPEKHKLTSEPIAFERYNIDLSSDQFQPEIYLLHYHPNADSVELFHRAEALKREGVKESSQSNRSTELLKSNLPVILECLHKSERLSKIIATSRDFSIESIVRSIEQSLVTTEKLFGPLLEQQELVQSIENAIQSFRQNENLFNLPSAIEASIKNKNYDTVVKEISVVLSRLQAVDMDKKLLEKIQSNVASKVEKLRKTIESQLCEICKSTNGERSIDDVKKIIGHLNKLGNYDVWNSIEGMSYSLIDTLTQKYSHFLELSRRAANQKNEPPHVVQFVQSGLIIFQNTYYDILKLGQSYFDAKDELSCKKSEEIKQARLLEFDKIASEPIIHLCNLLELALIPDSPELDESNSTLNPWPASETESSEFVKWLKPVLQSIINCHLQLSKVNLGASIEASKSFRNFVSAFRVRSMKILFQDATATNKRLYLEEDWELEINQYGSRTKLPIILEKNVVATLRFANETIFKTNLPDEQSILKQVNVQATFKELSQPLINSFIDSLENALSDNKVFPAESTRDLLASKESSRTLSKYEIRLLITICNCLYLKDEVFPKLQEEFENIQCMKMDRVFSACTKKHNNYIEKLKDKFCEMVLKEVGFKELDDIQINLMAINSQIFLIAPQLVNNIMRAIVNTVSAKITGTLM